MFDTLSERLGKIFKGLTGRGALSEADINAALREVRRALIEADVSLEVVRAFIEQVGARAKGAEVTRSITPGQQVIKIVNDELVRVLGEQAVPIDLRATPPVPILMVGLQGSGKTTSGQNCPAPEEKAQQESSAGLARHQPPRRHGTTQGIGRTDRG